MRFAPDRTVWRFIWVILTYVALVPPIAAQPFFYPAESNLPNLPGGRIRAEQLPTRRSSNLIIMGLLERGLPFSGLYRIGSEGKRVSPGGDITYLPNYDLDILPDALWDGDVIFEDLTNDGRADVLMTGNAARDSVAARPTIVFYREGTPGRVRTVPNLPALYGSRLAYRRGLLAIAGRGASGLALSVYRVTQAATPTFTSLAQLPGIEQPSLAFGDCDADGDLDLFASGATSQGIPMARLYRNDGGAFTPGVELPGLMRGEASFGDVNRDGTEDLAYTGYRYGPALAEGSVYLYRMSGCVPTRVALPVSFAGMMGDFLALEDVNSDGNLDLLVSGFNPPFRLQVSYLRIAVGQGNGTLTEEPAGRRASFGNGTGTLLTLPTGGPRPSVVGIGLGAQGRPGIWFWTRPEFQQ